MNEIKALERAAIDAFRNGIGWTAYWQQHGEQVQQAEPWNARRFKRLYDRLLALVTSGDTNGMTAMAEDDAAPWVADDQPSPHDSITRARLQPMPKMTG